MFVPMSSPRASLFPPCAFPMFVCLGHVPSCCCPCLHPSPVPNLPVCLYYWFLLCPVNSPCLVHLCLCLSRLDCSHLSLVICCLCVYIVLVFLLRLRKLLLPGMFLVFFPLFLFRCSSCS